MFTVAFEHLVEDFLRGPNAESTKESNSNIVDTVDLQIRYSVSQRVIIKITDCAILSNKFKKNKNKRFCDNRLHEEKQLML